MEPTGVHYFLLSGSLFGRFVMLFVFQDASISYRDVIMLSMSWARSFRHLSTINSRSAMGSGVVNQWRSPKEGWI